MADLNAVSQTASAAADAVSNGVSVSQLLLTLVRWAHYAAGVLWIGHLYFFNFVNANLQADAKYPPEFKKTVNPLLLSRAFFMFRWGAMFTFLTGLYLLYFIYMSATGIGFDNPRGLYILSGVGFGTIMWFNVWFVIWPRQKKIIGAAQGGPAPDPAYPKQAALASKINTYLSVPLLLGMMGGHDPNYQLPGGAAGLVVGVLLGFLVVYLAYKFAPKVDTQIYKA